MTENNAYNEQKAIKNIKDFEPSQDVIDSASVYMSNPDKNVIITDMDEILVMIAPYWTYQVWDNRDYFDRYMHVSDTFGDEFGEEALQKVIYRPRYYIDGWLERDVNELRANHVTKKEYDEYRKNYMNLYTNPDFYSDLKPTRIAEGFHQVLKSGQLSKLYIVTRLAGDYLSDSKIDFIKNTFHDCMGSVEIWTTDDGETKSDTINGIEGLDMSKVAAYYDDRNEEIVDVIQNTKGLGSIEIYQPDFNYNIPSEKTLKIISDKGDLYTKYAYVPR